MTLPIQKATYRARAIACGFGVAKSGTHQIAVTCEIIDVDSEGVEHGTGEEITWIGSFTDKTTARTIESLGHLGWLGDDLSELDNLDAAGCANLLRESVDLVCEPEEYEGSLTLKVRWVNRPGAVKFAFKEPLAGDALKSFAARMKGTIRGARGAAGARPSTSQRQAAPANRNVGAKHPNAPGGNDDIPF